MGGGDGGWWVERAITTAFRRSGMTLQRGGAQLLLRYIEAEAGPQRDSADKIIADVVQLLKHHRSARATISRDHVAQALHDLELAPDIDADDRDALEIGNKPLESSSLAGELDVHEPIQSVSARWRYDCSTRAFKLVDEASLKLHADVDERSAMMRRRIAIVRERLERDEFFAPVALEAARNKRDNYELTPLESLAGSGRRKCCVIGMLSQLEEGIYFLEDADARVRLDLRHCSYTSGMFTEGSILLAEGKLAEHWRGNRASDIGSVANGAYVLEVSQLGLPLPESRDLTLRSHPELDVCDGMDKKVLGMAEQEMARRMHAFDHGDEAFIDRHNVRERENTMVVLSEVHLDQPRVMERLEQVFRGFDEEPPLIFVLCGNFTSKPFGNNSGDIIQLRALFDDVALLISNYEGIRQCHFYFVPGPHDLGIGASLPRPPLPKVVTERLRRNPRVQCVGNPFRLRFMTQEVVFFRYNLFRAMRKHCILTPRDPEGNVTPVEHMLKTICDEGHLIPLPLHVQPVYWSLDHHLQLNPLPTVFVLADTLPQLQNEYLGCKVVIPGSFAADGEFLLYNLPTSAINFSEVK